MLEISAWASKIRSKMDCEKLVQSYHSPCTSCQAPWYAFYTEHKQPQQCFWLLNDVVSEQRPIQLVLGRNRFSLLVSFLRSKGIQPSSSIPQSAGRSSRLFGPLAEFLSRLRCSADLCRTQSHTFMINERICKTL